MARTPDAMPKARLSIELPASLSRRESNKLTKQIALFDSAMQLFAQSSYEAVSVDDICEHAGYGRATFYRLFGNKAGLIEEMHRRLALSIDTAVRKSMASGIVALKIAGEVMRDAWVDNRLLIYDLVAEYIRNLDQLYATSEPKIDATRYGGYALAGLAARFVAEGQARGEIRKGVDPIFVGILIMSQIGIALVLWAGREDQNAEDLRAKLDQAMEMAIHGIAA